MSNPNAVVARVEGLSPHVTLEGGLTAKLPPSKAAPVWRRMLEYTQTYGLPAYIEIDPETSVITNVLVPMRANVVGIEPAGEDIRVAFTPLHAFYILSRSNSDFHDLLNALEAARDAGTAVLMTATPGREIVDVRPAPVPPPLAPAPPPPPPGPGPEGGAPPSVVDEAKAVALFNEMAGKSCDPFTIPPDCIPFLYPDDGCFARAHEMARLMRLQGIEPEKIFIFGNLAPLTSNSPECGVGWWYHVAPTLRVNVSGVEQKRVIDPSLMDGPATRDQWRTRQADLSATFDETNAEAYYPATRPFNGTYVGDPDYSQPTQDLIAFRNALYSRVTVEAGPLPYTCPFVKTLQFVLDRTTFGEDEVAAMLQHANPAIIEAALYVVLDGFTPHSIGINTTTPTDPPTIKPNFPNPSVAQMEIKATHLDLEHPYLKRHQRITWTYQVRFTGTDGFNFTGETQPVSLSVSMDGLTATASILLIKQANPYEMDGAVGWLSTDLRVFQINEGETKFGVQMGATAADAPGFIAQVIKKLTDGTTGGQTFDNALFVDQQASILELSTKVNQKNVFNFAVARVRYVGLTKAQDVRVFFRLFAAATTSLAYDTSTTYQRGGQGGVEIPLLGVQNNQLLTIPFFATARVDSATTSLNQQSDPPNVQTIDASTTEKHAYFGAWLDFNQTAEQFPLNPSSGSGSFPTNRKSIYELVRAAHQCLVAEIAFDPAPPQLMSTPGSSDKLAQRNLAWVETANPGVAGSRRIAQTFEIRPTSPHLPGGVPHDELMIDWGKTPVGSTAKLYLPAVNAEDVIELARRMYRITDLALIDEHTLQFRTGGMSWIPIPKGTINFTGLLTIDLPPTVRAGQQFTVVARQVTGHIQPVVKKTEVSAVATPAMRRILGSFQITIPVRTKEVLLAREQRLLSNLRFIERSMPADDRWYAVFRRYLSHIAARVDGLGGDSTQVGPSPSGEWQQPTTGGALCRLLQFVSAALLAILLALGATSGATQVVLGLLVLALLFVIGYAWIRHCRPNGGLVVSTIVFGIVAGVIVLMLLRLLGP